MLVVDASALVAALLVTRDSGELRGLLAEHQLHAPTLLEFEVLSALRGLCLRGTLTEERAVGASVDLLDLDIRLWALDAGMAARVLELRHNVSSYDATYLALAESLSCPLVTRDRGLASSASRYVDVRGQ